MNFENQGVIKRLADQYGPENLTVVLGNGEANGVEVFAETVTEGDPSYAGPLAGVALKIPVYHVLEEEVMGRGAGKSARGKIAALGIGHRHRADASGVSKRRGRKSKTVQAFKWFKCSSGCSNIPKLELLNDLNLWNAVISDTAL